MELALRITQGLLYIIIAMIIMFAMIIMLRSCDKRPDNDRITYRDSLAASQARVDALEGQLEASRQEFGQITARHKTDSAAWAESSARGRAETVRLRGTIETLRLSVQPMIDTSEALARYDAAKDSLISHLQTEVDTLTHQLTLSQITTRDLINAHQTTERFNERIRQELENRSAIAEQRVAVLEKKARSVTPKIIAVGVLAALLGWGIGQ